MPEKYDKHTLLRYLASGSITLAVHFCILIYLVAHHTAPPLLASAAGYSLAMLINSAIQYRWTFKIRCHRYRFVYRFIALFFTTFSINITLLWILFEYCHQNFLIAQTATSSIIALISLILNRSNLFKHPELPGNLSADDKPLISRKYLGSFIRYFIAGGTAMLSHFATLILLVEKFAVEPVIATTIGFCLAVLVSYTGQYYWTFKVSGPHLGFLLRYLMVTSLTLGVNTGLFWAMFNLFYQPYIISQLFATGTVFLLNFLINHHYTFKSRG